MEIEIGRGKKARRAYGFDDIAIVPCRRTGTLRTSTSAGSRRPTDRAAAPGLGHGRGGVAGDGDRDRAARRRRRAQPRGPVGPLRGRRPLLAEIPALPARRPRGACRRSTRRRQAGADGAAHPRDQGRRRGRRRLAHAAARAGALQRVLEAGLDILVIQGTVVSAEHVSRAVEPLNLKGFIARVDMPVVVGGCAAYQTALHLMRTGAAGVLVGVGPGAACTTRGVLGVGVPQATAIADAAAARSSTCGDRPLRQRHRRRRHAHRRRHRQGHRLRRRRGDGRLPAGPGPRGARARLPLGHGDVPPDAPARRPGARRSRSDAQGDPARAGPRERRHAQPVRRAADLDGHTGYETIQEFQKAEIMVAPALKTEGKTLQREQSVGMGR